MRNRIEWQVMVVVGLSKNRPIAENIHHKVWAAAGACEFLSLGGARMQCVRISWRGGTKVKDRTGRRG